MLESVPLQGWARLLLVLMGSAWALLAKPSEVRLLLLRPFSPARLCLLPIVFQKRFLHSIEWEPEASVHLGQFGVRPCLTNIASVM